jgi:cyclopropane fatty-acyl-phospholipid synthase-like methyltransferase
MHEQQRRLVMKIAAENVGQPSDRWDGSGREVGPQHRKVVSVPNLTENVLYRSPIKRGSHVLDLGCGVGDASFLIAKLVGPTGLVVGVDESAEVIDVAQRRARVTGQCYWTRFVTADPNAFNSRELFDAVIVRLELLLQPEHTTFSRLAACIHPDGVVMIVSGEPAGSWAAQSSRE